jgi:hypothetical protein
MGKLDQILEWKKKWGYDDFAVMPGGRPMKAFGPDREAMDKLAASLDDEEAAERMRARFENPASRRLKGLLDRVEDAELKVKLEAEIKRIRLTDDPPNSALIQEVAEAIRATDDVEASSLDEWHDDLQHPYDPAQGPLATSIADRIRGRNILDRSAVIDQVTNEIYSADRRKELETLTRGHYLAKAFGLRAIREEHTNNQVLAGIRFSHEASSRYQRDDLEKGVTATMQGLYGAAKAALRDPSLPAYHKDRVFFVNSARVDAKLSKTYTPQWTDPKSPATQYQKDYLKTIRIKPGVFAIVMKKNVGPGFKTRLLEGSGCTPSAYQVEKVKDASAGTDPLTHPSMRDRSLPPNDATLTRVAASRGCRGLAQLPGHSPLKQAALAASKMVTGLEAALAKLKGTANWAAVQDNKLVANALQKIERLMETMPTYTEDVPRFSRLFDLLVDEVYLVLATCKPYGKDDYRQAAGAMIEERIPTLKEVDMANVKHSTVMLSSGMDGLSTAVAAAFAATGSKKLHLIDGGGDHSSNYFEVEANLLGTATSGPTGAPVGGPTYTPPVIMGTLNPSTPVKQARPGAPLGKGDSSWSVATLIGKINAVLNVHKDLLTEGKPAVAIIDVTVERNASGHDQEMDKLVADPTIKKALKEGKLKLMLAKSYQKYPSLGAGKTMAGGLTVIGKNIQPDAEPLKTVADAETAEGMLPGGPDPAYDESQIVTHFMTHERDAERNMMERAAKNAKFVRSLMPADADVESSEVRFDEGLPFLVFDKKGLEVNKPGGRPRKVNVSTTLMAQGVEERMSFGFQNTSCLGFGELMRVGIGQESEEDLIEKLYAVTNLAAKPEPGGITADKTIAMAGKAANKAMVQAKTALAGRVPGEGGDKAWRERMLRVLTSAGALRDGGLQKAQNLSTRETPEKEPARKSWIDETVKVLQDGGSGLPVWSEDTDPEKNEYTKALRGALNAQLDKNLQERLQSITDDTSETDLSKLGNKIALAAALRPARVAEPALALSTEKTPEDEEGRRLWIAKAEEVLKARGIALPVRGGEDKKYVEALRGALHGADDADLAHAYATKTWGDDPGADKLGSESQFLPNIVASCANLISTTLDNPGKFIQLADVLIEQGLDELSPEGQERLLYRRVQASLAGSRSEIAADLPKLKEVAGKMPYREGLANLVNGSNFEDAVKRPMPDALSDENVKDIVKALAGPLDITTQCELFGQLAKDAATKPAKKRIAQQYKAVLEERFTTLARAYIPAEPLKEVEKGDKIPPNPPPRVDPPMAARDIRRGATGAATHGPQPMTELQFGKLKLQFDGIKGSV